MDCYPRGTVMLRLCSKNIYLAALEKEHCRKLWEEYEYDFQSATEPLNRAFQYES